MTLSASIGGPMVLIASLYPGEFWPPTLFSLVPFGLIALALALLVTRPVLATVGPIGVTGIRAHASWDEVESIGFDRMGTMGDFCAFRRFGTVRQVPIFFALCCERPEFLNVLERHAPERFGARIAELWFE